MMKRLLLLACFCCLGLALPAQVEFDSGNDEWFKTYGVPNVPIYETYSDALKAGRNAIKLNIKNDAVGKRIRKVDKMTEMELLQLVDCGVTQLPEEFGELHDLFILVSKKNPITYISPAVGRCRNLMYMELWDTRLDSLPMEMQYLRNLELLRIIGNTSDTLRFADSLKRFANLRSIQISDANVYKFPEAVLRSKKLESIVLSGCKIDTLPEDIFYLENVKELVMEGNNLTDLPASITKMKNLEVLSVKNNKLTHVSEFIAYLPKLRVLDVSENQIPLAELDILRVIFKRRGQFVSDYEKLIKQIEDEKKQK